MSEWMIVWCLLFEDRKGKAGLVGRMAEGADKGKLVFLPCDMREFGRKAGEVVPVRIDRNLPKVAHGAIHFEVTYRRRYLVGTKDEYTGSTTVVVKAAENTDWSGLSVFEAQSKFSIMASEAVVADQKDEDEREARQRRETEEREQAREKYKESLGLSKLGRELYDRLEGHDWYYQMSDDIGVYRSGRAAGEAINKLIEKIVSVGNRAEAERIWEMFASESKSPFPLAVAH